MLVGDFNSIANVAKSFQIMINIIISTHFQNARCMVQFSNSFKDFSISTSDLPLPQYVNPMSCVTGCDHYVITDPLVHHQAIINFCLALNKEYTFKGTIFLGNESINDYKFDKFAIGTLPIYAAHSIFIKLVNNDFVISAFDNWELNSYSVLNRWSILTNKFENDNIDEFFSNKRRKRLGGVLNIASMADQVPIILTEKSIGSEIIMMFEFGKSMNMTTIIRHEGNPDVPIFVLGYFGPPNGVGTYPISMMNLSFLTPKPKTLIKWLELLQVFELKLWLLIFSCYILIGCFFWIENIVNHNANCPRFLAITGLLLLQSLNHHKMPRNVRTRCLIATVLIMAVLISSMFSSGIVKSMMTVSYEGEVRTIEQLADSELMVDWINNPLNMYRLNSLSEAEKRAFSRWSLDNYKLPYDKRAIAHYITVTRLSTSLDKYFINILPYIQTMDYFYVKSYSAMGISRFEYLLYVPLLNKFMVRCKDTGLMIKWEWDAFRNENKMATLIEYLDTRVPPSKPTQLQFDHLRAVFGMWFIGNTFGLLTFALEQLWMMLLNITCYI